MIDEALHEPNETVPLFQPHKIYSLLDILGGGSATCDQCGRWQRFSALTPYMAQEYLKRFGWTFVEGQDLCPKCSQPQEKPA